MEMTLQELCPDRGSSSGETCVLTHGRHSRRDFLLLRPPILGASSHALCRKNRWLGCTSYITQEEVILGPHSPKISAGRTLFLQAEHSHTQKHP